MAEPDFELFLPDEGERDAFERLRPGRPGAAVPEPVAPGARCLLARRGGEPVARCSLHLAADMVGAPGRSGLIGHYEAADAEAGAALLHHACRLLGADRVDRVLGPMNGSTWARYRLALPTSPGGPSREPPPFLTEPVNPPDYLDHWQCAGFQPAAFYESRIDTRIKAVRSGAPALRARLERGGIRIRPLDPVRYEEDLEAVFALSREAFSRNLYYTPISSEAFHALYAGIRPLIDPDLVRLAYGRTGRLLGFLFAFPDPLVSPEERRVVAKTVATAPEARRLGLGMRLVDEIREIACAKGYRAVLHALMHCDNPSTRTSARHDTDLYRRYVLFERRP